MAATYEELQRFREQLIQDEVHERERRREERERREREEARRLQLEAEKRAAREAADAARAAEARERTAAEAPAEVERLGWELVQVGGDGRPFVAKRPVGKGASYASSLLYLDLLREIHVRERGRRQSR